MPNEPTDEFIMEAARTLRLSVEPDWMDAVRRNLEATLQHAAVVMEFELPDDAEPAPIFKA
jgi:hypothetical protein